MTIYDSMIAFSNLVPNLHYLRRYCKIVQLFKDRNLTKQRGFHSHHIIPKSFNGSDSKENRVIVSPREHFILHWMLWKSFPKSGMATAFKSMCCGWKHYHEFRITSRVYENVITGITHSEETKARLSEIAKKRALRKKIQCPHCHKKSDYMNYYKLHGDRCKLNPHRDDSLDYHQSPEQRLASSVRVHKEIESGTHNFLTQINPGTIKSVSCLFCKRTFNKTIFTRFHGNKCKCNPEYVIDQSRIESAKKGHITRRSRSLQDLISN